MLSFIHLSDIHFNKNNGDKYDPDNELRKELLFDISNNCKFENMQGVLICGDIAFSGKKEEYEGAKDFLKTICDSLSIGHDRVFCVPGNHDVNQSVPKKNMAIKLLQDKLESTETVELFDDILARIHRADEDREQLYRPIEEYNRFATQYCSTASQDEHILLFKIALSDKYILKIFGMNSTVISNADDHKSQETERLMRIGRSMLPQREQNTIILTLCHHPPECWKDTDKQLEGTMNHRVNIQLYGHKHIQTIKQAKTGSIIVGSGATQPSRKEQIWQPMYNWIEIDIETEGQTDYLLVNIYPRIFCKEKGAFDCDYSQCEEGKVYKHFAIPIDPVQTVTDQTNTATNMTEEEETGELDENQDSLKKYFVYTFLNLSQPKQRAFLREYEIDIDRSIDPIHYINDIINIIIKRNCLKRICSELENYHVHSK